MRRFADTVFSYITSNMQYSNSKFESCSGKTFQSFKFFEVHFNGFENNQNIFVFKIRPLFTRLNVL